MKALSCNPQSAICLSLCGAGALGGNIAESLARAGVGALRVIDRDRVEERNLSTQPYMRSEIGAMKATMLANMIYRAVGVKVDAIAKELTEANVGKLLRGSDLVVDVFDNSVSRGIVTRWCADNGVACLHVGLAEGYAEIIWNERYRVPSPASDDVCHDPLARSLVMLATAVACETIIRFVMRGERKSWTITLDDCAVKALT
jgi:molybdopterin/thiamine biosynthesis adenylyltransferase